MSAELTAPESRLVFAGPDGEPPLVEGMELHLYIVEFLGHGVKVGITKNPQQRIASHRRDAAAYGRTVGRVWLSRPHVEARANESAIKRLAGSKREYLPIGFEVAVERAELLPQSRAAKSAIKERQRRTEAFLDSFFKPFLGGQLNER